MTRAFRYVAVVVLVITGSSRVVTACPVAFEYSGRRPGDAERDIPPTVRESAVKLLQYVQRQALPIEGVFDVSKGLPLEPSRISEIASPDGIVFTDVNARVRTARLPYSETASYLKKRTSRFYVALIHLGFISRQPYPQYSRQSWRRAGDVFELRIASWYVLQFKIVDGLGRLAEVDYVNFEAE
jgi:hypothetical protein